MVETESESDLTELFARLCIPEILNEILPSLTGKDRIHFRAATRASEAGLAKTDFHIAGSNSEICINGGSEKLTLGIGNDLKLMKECEDNGLNDLLRLRKRLFKRAVFKTLAIAEVNFNVVPPSFLEELLKGCVFEELRMTIKKEGYNEEINDFVLKHKNKLIKLTVDGFFLDDQILLSLDHTRTLQIVNTNDTLSEDTLFNLLQMRHELIEISEAFASAQAVVDAVKIIASSKCEKHLITGMKEELLDEFLLLIGMRRTDNGIDEVSNADFVLDLMMMIGDKFEGDFLLEYREKVVIIVTSPKSGKLFSMTLKREQDR